MSLLEILAASILAATLIGAVLFVAFAWYMLRAVTKIVRMTSFDVDEQAGHICSLLKHHNLDMQHKALVKAWETLVEPEIRQQSAELSALVKRAHFNVSGTGETH